MNIAVWVADKAYIAVAGISLIAKAVSLAIHLSVEGARRGYLHYKQNKYLDEMNEKFFKPRGLYCMIIKHKLSRNELYETVDIDRNIAQEVTERDTANRSMWKNLVSASAGTTKHEEEVPEAAPLIFPYLEILDEKQKENEIRRFGHVMQDYFDRRSHAQFEAQHPDSKIPTAPRKESAGRYADPNHPASQGGMVSIVTGGKYNPTSSRLSGMQERRNARRARLDLSGQPTGPNASEQRKQQRPLRRMLKEDALYLIVVNMPSKDEMAKVMAEIEMANGNA
jgi:hypothetical protein